MTSNIFHELRQAVQSLSLADALLYLAVALAATAMLGFFHRLRNLWLRYTLGPFLIASWLYIVLATHAPNAVADIGILAGVLYCIIGDKLALRVSQVISRMRW